MRLCKLFAAMTLVGCIGCGAREEPKQAKNDPLKGVVFGDPKPWQPPEPEPGPPPDVLKVKPNPPPKGLVRGVRAAAFRPQRLNELRQIGIFFQTFADTNSGKAPRTEEEFCEYIKRDANHIVTAIKEQYYILNLKVNMRDANSVVAYESLSDQGGFQTVRVDGSVAPVEENDLRKLLMQ